MEHDIKEDRRFLQSKQGLKQDKVARTADGQKFRQSLNNAKEYGLEDVDFDTPSFKSFCRERF